MLVFIGLVGVMKLNFKVAVAALLLTAFGIVNPTLLTSANATTLVGTASAATGVDELKVGSTLYDVTFDLGTADALFQTYTPIFTNVTEANAAASALISALNTLGVTGLSPQENPYEINVPYSTVSAGNYSATEFSYDVWTPHAWGENAGYQNVSLPGDYDYGHNFIAEFTVAATPLPSSWTMLLVGFAGIGFFAYLGKKRSADVAAA